MASSLSPFCLFNLHVAVGLGKILVLSFARRRGKLVGPGVSLGQKGSRRCLWASSTHFSTLGVFRDHFESSRDVILVDTAAKYGCSYGFNLDYLPKAQ